MQLERDRTVVEFRDDPADGAREPQTRAVAPAHRLAEADALDQTFGDLGHQLGELTGLAGDLGEHHLATVTSGADDQVLDRDALLLRKALGGFGGFAVGVECRGRRGTRDGLGLAALALRQTGDADSEPTWGNPDGEAASRPNP